MHFLLFHAASEDYMERRAAYRDDHLNKVWAAVDRGELVLGGPLANPTDGAVLLFQGDSREASEEFARTDPFVLQGLVKRWYVREWTTVAGAMASTPLRPSK